MPTGQIVQVNVKPEGSGRPGLPKKPVESARATAGGLEGDFNHYRTYSKGGDPDNALMIMTTEAIEDLNREGWPVRAGDIGENVTISGVAYGDFEPGRRVRVGGATVEITKAANPCANLYTLPYVGEERGPAFLKTMMGRRGWYARVIEAGELAPGGPVELISDGESA